MDDDSTTFWLFRSKKEVYLRYFQYQAVTSLIITEFIHNARYSHLLLDTAVINLQG